MYNAMVLQLEDCADVVKTLNPQYYFLFLFDCSCCHDHMPDDALKVEEMNKGYGGEQNKMKASTISSVEGYLGPYMHNHKEKNNIYSTLPHCSPRITENSRPTRLAHESVRGHVVFFLSWLEIASNRMNSI
jgi:hypothetical protein